MPTSRVSALLTTLVLTGALLAGCGQGTGSPDSQSSGSGTLGDIAASPSASASGTGNDGNTAQQVPPSYPGDIIEYAKQAVQAWTDKNAVRVDQLEAGGGTLHTMLGCVDCYEPHFSYSTCPNQGPYVLCVFFNGVGDELRLRGDPSLAGQAHAILAAGSSLEQISFPSDNKAYAELAMGAWLNRNDNRLKLLTLGSKTSAQIDALGANRNAQWNFDRTDGAAGSLYYVWKDPQGHTLALRFTNGPAAPTTGPEAQHRITDIVYLP
jgi:hypothetical protein